MVFRPESGKWEEQEVRHGRSGLTSAFRRRLEALGWRMWHFFRHGEGTSGCWYFAFRLPGNADDTTLFA